MEKFTNHRFIRSTFILALALTLWTPLQTHSADPDEGKAMKEGKMMERCQDMMKQKEQMHHQTQVQNAELTEQVAAMNSAPDDKKVGLMAAIVTRMAEQRTATDAHSGKMHEAMMGHMMQHMQMGKKSMAQCPIMKGMKGMEDMDDKSEGGHNNHHDDSK